MWKGEELPVRSKMEVHENEAYRELQGGWSNAERDSKEEREQRRCLEKMKTVMNNLCFKRTSLYVPKN